MTDQVNSESAPTERKPVKKVINGEIIQRKPSLGRKLAETFTGEEAQGVGSYVIRGVILPSVKSMIVEAGTQALERIFLGEAATRRSNSPLMSPNRARTSNYNSYNRYFGSESQSKPVAQERSRPSYEVMDIIVASRPDAQEIIDTLMSILQQYPTVSVAELYEAVGQTSRFTDNNWGWDREHFQCGISRVREGFRVDLPRPISIQ